MVISLLSTEPLPLLSVHVGRMVTRFLCSSGCCAAKSLIDNSTASASRVEMICESFLPLTKTHGKSVWQTSNENQADFFGTALPCSSR